MGIAAHQRGDAVIRRHFSTERNDAVRVEADRQAIAIDAEITTWRRDAWALIVDATSGDARGFAGRAIEAVANKGSRVFVARERAVLEAHVAWLDSDPMDVLGHLAATQAWGRAVHRLLVWCLGQWAHPLRDSAHRSIK